MTVEEVLTLVHSPNQIFMMLWLSRCALAMVLTGESACNMVFIPRGHLACNMTLASNCCKAKPIDLKHPKHIKASR